jgi:hypothetical protein
VPPPGKNYSSPEAILIVSASSGMVNGRDHAQDIADIAVKFETVLLAANYVAGAKAVPAMLISPLN